MYDESQMVTSDATDDDGSLATWFRKLVLHPVRPAGDYFDRLRTDVEASAPVCSACG